MSTLLTYLSAYFEILRKFDNTYESNRTALFAVFPSSYLKEKLNNLIVYNSKEEEFLKHFLHTNNATFITQNQ